MADPRPATPRAPQRTCVGCRAVVPQHQLVRLVFDGPRLVVDAARVRPGRGAYVHAAASCLASAGRGGIARSLRRAVQPGDLKRIVAEMSPTDDKSGGSPPPEAVADHPEDRGGGNRENVAGLGATKTVEPPPHGVVTDSELN